MCSSPSTLVWLHDDSRSTRWYSLLVFMLKWPQYICTVLPSDWLPCFCEIPAQFDGLGNATRVSSDEAVSHFLLERSSTQPLNKRSLWSQDEQQCRRFEPLCCYLQLPVTAWTCLERLSRFASFPVIRGYITHRLLRLRIYRRRLLPYLSCLDLRWRWQRSVGLFPLIQGRVICVWAG